MASGGGNPTRRPWIRAANEAIAGSAEQIERILLRNPVGQGESRAGNVRIWFHRPIGVLSQIDEVAKRVTVLAIKWGGR